MSRRHFAPRHVSAINARWVHVTATGEEIDYPSQPADEKVPTQRVSITRFAGDYVEETTLTRRRPTEDGGSSVVYPRGHGWEYDGRVGGSSRWKRKRPLKTSEEERA